MQAAATQMAALREEVSYIFYVRELEFSQRLHAWRRKVLQVFVDLPAIGVPVR